MMIDSVSERLLGRMFLARRLAVQAVLVMLGLSAGLYLGTTYELLTERGQVLLGIAIGVDAIVLCALSLAIGYYAFRIGLREKGPLYAVGHAALCVLFIPLGAIVVPLLVREDVRRHEGTERKIAGSPGPPQ